MAILEHQNETISTNEIVFKNVSETLGIASKNNSRPSNSPRHPKMVTIRPSAPYSNFYRDYHSYIAVIFISFVLVIIVCSIIYVGLRKRKLRQIQKQKSLRREKRNLKKRPLSRQLSRRCSLGNYESFSSRRSNNKHARLTSQRSWADSPLTGIESPFYEEILNKSLPSTMDAENVCYDIGTPIGPHDISFASVSDDTTSSTSELAKFCRQQQVLSPAFDIRSESISPGSVLENRHHHIPLTQLTSSGGRGIIVQISSMDLISTAIPRSPFSSRRGSRSTNASSSPTSSTSNSLKSSNENLTQSMDETKPMGTISE